MTKNSIQKFTYFYLGRSPQPICLPAARAAPTFQKNAAARAREGNQPI